MENLVTADFWRGKTVLVTGHTGFKGGWLSLWLQSLNANVVGYARPPSTTPSVFEAAGVGRGMASIIGDLADLPKLKAVLAEHAPAIVFHMAAQALVRTSYESPIETYKTNVLGTAHLLEAVRTTGGVKVVVSVTSDKCYENREWIYGYRENEALGGHDPYSSSKACAELVTAAYRNSFFPPRDYQRHGVAVASVRAGNVIGGGDWAADRLVPDFIRAATCGEPLVVRNPQAVRPWQHVLEPLYGYLLLAERLWSEGPLYGDAWNFGPDDESTKSVASVVESLVAAWGAETLSHMQPSASQPHEASYLKLDCSKAKARLGWHPRWNLEKALEATVNWYKAHRSGQDMKRFSVDQVRSYVTQTRQ